ncbi:MAG: YidC/Oxa1 family membrane protein insertase [Clostridia bacterium]|nr:YidC/Oxa1 family membrane protein insertase [Clostridia bacterium]
MNIINFAQPFTDSFLVDIMIWLVETFGSIAMGIVLFTVILKLLTLPFDFMSRFSMRKNSLLMEQMRPDLEKLQKQYANNKELYNQKMMALYKKNGYSMWGSCLPTILTLVIFIVAINGFNAYSQYQNKVNFYEMSRAYNSVIYDGFELDDKYITKDANGNLVFLDSDLYPLVKDGVAQTANHNIVVNYKHNDNGVIVSTENGYTKVILTFDKELKNIVSKEYKIIVENLFSDKAFTFANDKIFAGFELDNTYIYRDDVNKKLVFNDLEFYNQAKDNGEAEITAGDHKIFVSIVGRTMTVYTENGYIRYQKDFVLENGVPTFSNNVKYSVIEKQLFNEVAIEKEGVDFFFGIETDDTYIKVDAEKNIVIDGVKLLEKAVTSVENTNIKIAKTDLGYTLFTNTDDSYMQYFREVSVDNGETKFNSVSFMARSTVLLNNETLLDDSGKKFSEVEISADEFLLGIAQTRSAEAFRANDASFLWVKNIWVADGAHKHPVLEYDEFKGLVATTDNSGCGCGCACDGSTIEAPISKENYDSLTFKLAEEKTSPNGYYILCILSAGISLLTQLVMNKGQKAQLELQTVDGQGAQNQKMMTYMMPIMMAVFSFIYTSAFSIYIIISSLISVLTTFGINYLADKKFKKANPTKQVIRGRVYVEPEKEKKSKSKKK